MRRSLRFNITVAFLALTILSFSLLGILANVLVKKQFQSYVIENLNRTNNDIVETLEGRYADWGSIWDPAGLESIGLAAMSDGLILRVADSTGAVVWDAMVHNSGLCAAMLQTMADNMSRINGGFDGGYTEKTYDIVVYGARTGTVTIGYYGPYFYTENDIQYLKTLNFLILTMTLLVGALSLVFGTFLARRLAGPIAKVIHTTEEIARGNYGVRLTDTTGTREIRELTNAVNSLAETLDQLETLRKRLTADVAHELRTPLANLQSHLEAMIDGIWESDTQRLQSCHEEAVRLFKIVADLESLARLEGEGLRLQKETVDLAPLIRQTVNSFEGERTGKDIDLRLILQNIQVEADRDKLIQVMVNLISNALKYTPAGGGIEIEARRDGATGYITVRDTGVGIPAEDLPYVFERFYRADRSRARASGGSGIGLAIVKTIVTAHGGSVSVESEPGGGSAFTVMLPL